MCEVGVHSVTGYIGGGLGRAEVHGEMEHIGRTGHVKDG